LSGVLIVLRPSLIAGRRLLREKIPWFHQKKENNCREHERTAELCRVFPSARGTAW
jgi:hypothetical protein